jgi:hypothetical protein
MVGSYSMKKFMSLTYLIKPVQQEMLFILYKYAQSHVHRQCWIISQHLPSRASQYFLGPCHGVSSASHIRFVVGSDTMKKFMDLTHLVKPVQQESIVHSL